MKETKEKNLEEQRLFYAEKFEGLNWILQPGEQIVQASTKYPPYWFVSSMGYVLSLRGKSPKKLKPGFSRCGLRNKNGDRYNPDWTLRFAPFLPVYSEEQVSSGKLVTVRLAKIIGEHFPQVYDSPEYEGEPWELHHCEGKQHFTPEQGEECNRAENLRWTRRPVHKKLTKLQNRTFEQKQQDMNEAMANKPQIEIEPGTLENILKVLLTLGVKPEAAVLQTYFPNGDTESIDITRNINLLFKDTPSEGQPIKLDSKTGQVTISGVSVEISNWKNLSEEKRQQVKETFALVNLQYLQASQNKDTDRLSNMPESTDTSIDIRFDFKSNNQEEQGEGKHTDR